VILCHETESLHAAVAALATLRVSTAAEVGAKPWLVDVWRLERRYGEQPKMKQVSVANRVYTVAVDDANDWAKIQSMAEPNNPNPVLVIDIHGSCYSAFINGKRTHCPDEMVRRNPYTSSWPIYEVRIRYHKQRNAWIPVTYKKMPGENPKIEEDFMGYHQRGQALEAIKNYAHLLSRRPWDQSWGSPNDLRNPNPVRVLDEHGRCVTAYLAGKEIGCPNPVPPEQSSGIKLGHILAGGAIAALVWTFRQSIFGSDNPLAQVAGRIISRDARAATTYTRLATPEIGGGLHGAGRYLISVTPSGFETLRSYAATVLRSDTGATVMGPFQGWRDENDMNHLSEFQSVGDGDDASRARMTVVLGMPYGYGTLPDSIDPKVWQVK